MHITPLSPHNGITITFLCLHEALKQVAKRQTTYLTDDTYKSINQSKHISIAPYVASESEAHKWQMTNNAFKTTSKKWIHTCNLCPDVDTGASERNRRRTALMLRSVIMAVMIHRSMLLAWRMLVSRASVWKARTQIRGDTVGSVTKDDSKPVTAARSSAMAGARVMSKLTPAVPTPSLLQFVPSSFSRSQVCSRTSRLMQPLGKRANRLLKQELSVSKDDISGCIPCWSSTAICTSNQNKQ